ncbi:MAG: hypothetical protein KDE53_38390, partial [Caldilineaceae bacterium]|nr:hypothetical protein [Caldilineaceae bacterium]
MTPNNVRSTESTDLSPSIPQSTPTEPSVGPLELAAGKLAHTQQAVIVDERQLKIDVRLKKLAAWLDEAHTRFATDRSDGTLPSYAAEWMLDNFYVIQQALRQIKEDLPETFYGQLPKLPADWVNNVYDHVTEGEPIQGSGLTA